MSDLLKINVNDHTERKGNLTYLSWAWAWAEVLKIDPAAVWQPYETDGLPVMYFKDDTAMVRVGVTINGNHKSCVLPVMDNRNRAIQNPDAFAINTAIMRCLAKAIAMHGLGLYIYAGEDLPEGEPESKNTKPISAGVITPLDGAGESLTDDEKHEMQDIALYLVDCHKNEREMDAIRAWYDPATFASNEQRV